MSHPEFPSNSRRPLEVSNPLGNRAPSEGAEPKLAKIEGIEVVRRNKSLGRRLMDTFFRGNGSVVSYLVMDVLVPAAQTLVLDMVTQGLEKKFYGEVRSAPRRPGSRIVGSPGVRPPHVSYDRASQNTIVRSPQISGPARRPATPQASALDPGDVVIDTEFGAQMIVEKLYEAIESYGAATVANLKELLGESAQYTDHKWGWPEGSEFRIKRIRDGYRIDYPEPEDLR